MPSLQTKPWIVQKYGGTSIGKFLPNITDAILPFYLQAHRVAIICSARSGATKSTGTTSLLLEATRLATNGPQYQADFYKIIDRIKSGHLHAAEHAILASATGILARTQEGIRKDCESLRSLLDAIILLAEVSDRSTDRILAFGETLSCRITAAALTSRARKRTPSSIFDLLADTTREHPRRSSPSRIS